MDKVNLNLAKPLSYGQVEAKKSEDAKQSEQKADVQLTPRDSEQILNALGFMGLAARAQHGLDTVDPKKYLSPDRIADIEKSMQTFESGVTKQMTNLEREFGFLAEYSSPSDADKLEMAAKAFTSDDAA